MAINYLWDTNTAIYFLHNSFPEKGRKFIEKNLLIAKPAISVITEIELLCWKPEMASAMQVVHSFIAKAQVVELSQQIKLATAEIRKEFKIKLPDAIVAATAITLVVPLITRNEKDFLAIPDLQLVNPFNL